MGYIRSFLFFRGVWDYVGKNLSKFRAVALI